MKVEAMAGVAWAVACCISAGAAVVDAPPARLRDAGKASMPLVRYGETSAIDISGRYTEPVCHYRFLDSYFGYLDDDQYGLKGKIPFNFNCYDDNESLTRGMAARFDKASGKWVRSIENRYGQPESESERHELENAIHLYSLSGVNSTGFAYTEDDLMGDEPGRRRVLHYCLIHPPKALCGDGEMGYVEDIRHHPKNDLTQYALKILRSIEFLDEPATPDAASSPH